MPDNQHKVNFITIITTFIINGNFLTLDNGTYFFYCHLPVLLYLEISSVKFMFPKYKPYNSSFSVYFFPFSICALTNCVGKEFTDVLGLFSVHVQSVLSPDICHLNTYSSFSKFNCKNFPAITIFRTHVCEENGLLLYCK